MTEQQNAPLARSISVAAHGRYLVAPAEGAGPAPLVVGFHGYAENAELMMERLQSIPGSDRRLSVSIQGLHRFYRGRSEDVVASWMTRQDRELAIADNCAFVGGVIEAVAREWPVTTTLVFVGFSQGVAMAFRAASVSTRRPSGLVSLGGDVPPELDGSVLASTHRMLIGRGERDDWYTAEQWQSDLRRLREAGVDAQALGLDAGHEWTTEFSRAAGRFLDSLA